MYLVVLLVIWNLLVTFMLVGHARTGHPRHFRERLPFPPPPPPKEIEQPKPVDEDARRRALDETTVWEPYVQVNPAGRLYMGVWRKAEEYQFGVTMMYEDLDPDEDHQKKFDHATARALKLNRFSAK